MHDIENERNLKRAAEIAHDQAMKAEHWWRRAPELDSKHEGSEAWRHLWTGSVRWVKTKSSSETPSTRTDMSANDSDTTPDNAAHGGCRAATCCACVCGGEGQHFCHDLSREPGKEGYSVVCEDCGNESVIFATWEGATMAWNIMQRSARLRKRAVAMRERMKAKGAKPLPDYIVDETIRNLQRP